MNKETYLVHGKLAIDIANLLQMSSNLEIKNLLNDIVFHLIPDDIDFVYFDLLHKIWIEKFSNARIRNIMERFEIIEKHDSIFLKTSNRRDKLLGYS